MVNMWGHISSVSYLITLLDMLGDASFDCGHTECGSPCQIFDCDSFAVLLIVILLGYIKF